MKRMVWVLGATTAIATACTSPAKESDDDDGGSGAGDATSTVATSTSGTGGSSCSPDCTNLECGADPVCGQSCGTCSDAYCNAGTCVSDCTSGEVVCNGLGQVLTCVNGAWQSGSCPQHEVCVEDACQPVCDGMLATTTGPAACFFAAEVDGVKEMYAISTDTTKLEVPSTLAGAVWDGSQNAEIDAATNTAWPWQWIVSPQDTAIAAFRLTKMNPPLTFARFVYRASAFAKAKAVTVSATDGITSFASGEQTVALGWANYEMVIQPPLVESFSPGDLNTIELAITPSGLGCTPPPCDSFGLSWFMMELID